MPGTHSHQSELLRAREVQFAYGGHPVLRDISFALGAGQFVGLVGPNGTGKSTLLKVLGGLLPASAGQMALLGRSLDDYTAREVARIVAHVPQSTVLEFPFTVREVVLMGRSPFLGRFQLESALDREIAERAMRTTETLALADRPVNTLSGGEQQRVLIARALAQQPRILLLDEPTSNLDIRHQLALLALVRELAHEVGIGVVAALHDLPLAARFCDRVVMLAQGRVVADGTPAEVFTAYRLEQVFGVEVTLDREPVTGGLRLIPLRPAASR
ncbi:MAG: ABC transporter ATP-binding protein [Anaerolineae bacterium]